MSRIGIRRFRAAAMSALVLCAAGVAGSEAWAQGDGLTGNYYYGASAWNGSPYPPPPPPGSPEPGAATWTASTTRVDATINFVDGAATAWAPASSNVVVTWTGYVLTGADSGAYTFYINTDDGSRLWVNVPMTAGGEVVNSWKGQGPTTYQGNVTVLPNTFYPIRYEYFQGGGGSAAQLYWSSANVAKVIIPKTNLFSDNNPGVCTPPSALTATGGFDKALLNWTAGGNCTSYVILRGTTTGGPYTQIASGITTTTYTDKTATHPGPYFYVVQGTNSFGNTPYSNEATCTTKAPLISASPLAVQIAENKGQATVTVTLLGAPDMLGTVTVPVTSADGTKVKLLYNSPTGANMVTLSFAPGVTSQSFTVQGQDVGIGSPPPNYTVLVNFGTVLATDAGSPYNNYNSTGQDLGPVTCTILPDAPGIIVNPPSIAITNGGPQVSFTVQLAAAPTGGTVVLNLSLTDPTLATISTPLPITTAGFNNPVTVTVVPTLVDPQFTYTGPFDIVIDPSASTDPGYKALGQTLVPVDEPINLPPIKKVWSKCGLLGIEAFLPLALLLLSRRRARRKA